MIHAGPSCFRRLRIVLCALGLVPSLAAAQQMTTETRDPNQKQDDSFTKSYKEWLVNPKHGSPLVDHLPVAPATSRETKAARSSLLIVVIRVDRKASCRERVCLAV